MHDFLGEPLRERGARGELLGKGKGLFEQPLLRHDAVDESDPIRVFGIEEVAGEHHLQRVAQTHDLLEPNKAAIAGVESPSHVL